MGRWQPDAVGRLQQAALDLYAERGYEQTTVAEISQRGGLTERRIFRHFADKRKVLFRGSEELQKRQLVIDGNPELQERELIKLASLAAALADALRRRGVQDPAAGLTAGAGIAVLFRVAFEHWLRDDSDQNFGESVHDGLAELRTVAAG